MFCNFILVSKEKTPLRCQGVPIGRKPTARENVAMLKPHALPQRSKCLTQLALAVACLSVAAVGCATVQPYERETLARTDMQFEGAPEIEEGEQHATEVREGTVGGFGSGGGGCGCN